MEGKLSRTPEYPNQEPPVTAAVAAPDMIDLTDISFKAGFHSLSLDDVIKITGLPLETNEEAMKMMIASKKHTWKDKNLTQYFREYFTITSKLLLWSTNNKEESALNHLIHQSECLEKRLQTHYTKINGRMKMIYLLLQLVASILAMIPLIGPLYVTLNLTNNDVDTRGSIVLSFGFLVIGAIGNGGVWFFKRERNTLGVQEELIGPLLLSIFSRNKDLNRIKHDFLNGGSTMQNPGFTDAICALEKSLRSDRNLILQKLSEQNESTSSPQFSIRSDVYYN